MPHLCSGNLDKQSILTSTPTQSLLCFVNLLRKTNHIYTAEKLNLNWCRPNLMRSPCNMDTHSLPYPILIIIVHDVLLFPYLDYRKVIETKV